MCSDAPPRSMATGHDGGSEAYVSPTVDFLALAAATLLVAVATTVVLY